MADVDDIKAVKTKRNTLREKLEKRKKERQGVQDNLNTKTEPEFDVEKTILRVLSANSLVLPLISTQIATKIEKLSDELKPPTLDMVNYLLRKLANRGAIHIKDVTIGKDLGCEVIAVENDLIQEMYKEFMHDHHLSSSVAEELKRKSVKNEDDEDSCQPPKVSKYETAGMRVKDGSNLDASHDILSLLAMPSTREKQSKQVGEEILELLTKPTAKERSVAEKFKSHGGAQVMEFCPHGTKIECLKAQQATAEMATKKRLERKQQQQILEAAAVAVKVSENNLEKTEPDVKIEPQAASVEVKQETADQPSINANENDSGTEDGEIVADNTKAEDGELDANADSQQSTDENTADVDIIDALTDTCTKLHFKKIIQSHTDESLGDCSFLNTCFHMQTCKYVHYEVDTLPNINTNKPADVKTHLCIKRSHDPSVTLYPPQWIQCDLRFLDMTVLGKFAVVMADPPWDIHMELPYGTMSDDEMRQLGVPALQDDGLIFLWVTGRAMELGRECLKLWGYERVDELIWVKTNQLQRIIRTGRTGHWLNHGKEHCLVGMKGNPTNLNRGLDCDVIVAEVRATSHKPDEIYGIIERLSPGTRKIELFGRPHNVQPNWITLGNQLDGIRLVDPELITQFQKRYPDGNCMAPANAAAAAAAVGVGGVGGGGGVAVSGGTAATANAPAAINVVSI